MNRLTQKQKQKSSSGIENNISGTSIHPAGDSNYVRSDFYEYKDEQEQKQEGVYVADMLFATLDPTTRMYALLIIVPARIYFYI